jgi:hypothetical protein
MYRLHTPFSDLGTDGARKTANVSIKERDVSRHFSALLDRIDHAGNSLEKMIDKRGQMSIHDDLSPLVFDA